MRRCRGVFSTGCVKGVFSPNFQVDQKVHETAKTVGSRRMLLCKQNGKGSNLSTTGPGCGQVVWITLLRMWKTMSFQQLFGFPPFPAGRWKTLSTPVQNPQLSTGGAWLRHRAAPKKYREKSGPPVQFVAFSPRSDGGRTRPGPTNFVKNRQRATPFSLFHHVYQFPGLGNTDHVSSQTGGTCHAG